MHTYGDKWEEERYLLLCLISISVSQLYFYASFLYLNIFLSQFYASVLVPFIYLNSISLSQSSALCLKILNMQKPGCSEYKDSPQLFCDLIKKGNHTINISHTFG